MSLVVLLGGARSGKSSLAVRMATAHGADVVFVATGEPTDAEMSARIGRHREERPAHWTTIEAPLALAGALAAAPADAVVVVDCLSVWVSNLMAAGAPDIRRESARAAELAVARRAPTIAVSNEVGSGIVPMHPVGRAFRDLLGNVNADWVAASTAAALVFAGRMIPLDPVPAVFGGLRVGRR